MKSSHTLSQKLFAGLLAVVLTGLFSSSANAQLLDFTFSFVSYSIIPDSYPGTVTGEIFGLSSSGPSTPADVIIYTAPSGLASAWEAETPPLTFTTAYDFNAQAGSSFTGNLTVNTIDTVPTITAASFYASSGNSIGLTLDSVVGLGNGGNNLFSTSYTPMAADFDGIGAGGVTFTYAGIDNVPEPSTWALLLGGLGLLAFWRRRTRRAVIF